VARRHGEAYRTALEREAEALGVREHLVFRDQFVSNDELCRYLQATDIFISPYQNEAQVTSGALSYAMGAGAAAVSTPYWHAQELLANGRGRLFPFGDSQALASVLSGLLRSPADLQATRSAAFAFTRAMTWPQIGQAYMQLANTAIDAAPLNSHFVKPTRPSSLPDLRLDHLSRMTDDTGIIQHATFSVPARRDGYCADDNARALIVALWAERLSSAPVASRLVTTYLSYLDHCQTEDGSFRNFMGYDRHFVADRGSEDCLGRAVWALGTAVRLAHEDGQRLLAAGMLRRALPHTHQLGPRGTATTILGLVSLLQVDTGDEAARSLLATLADKLVNIHQHEATEDWNWFEPELTYDNALLPLALFKAFSITGERSSLRVARSTLEFLEEICFRDGQLVLVGNDGWHRRGGAKAPSDEQAIDAAAFVLSFRGAYLATGDHHYLVRMRQSFAWFLGANRLRLPLYDSVTGGCRDGLGAEHVNQNEGAESTLSFLMSLLEMLELAGEGLEHPESRRPGHN
jgi:hypothetical protein